MGVSAVVMVLLQAFGASHEGQLVFNTTALILKAGLAGFGLAYLPEKQVEKRLVNGELVRVPAN